MKRRWIALALLLTLAVSLTACQVEFIPYGQPTNNGGTTIDTPPRPGGDTDPVDVNDPAGGEEDPSGDNTDYTMEKYRRYLEGEWVGVEAEVEGDRYKLADEEMSVTLTFMSADGVTEDGHGTWSMGAWYKYANRYGDQEIWTACAWCSTRVPCTPAAAMTSGTRSWSAARRTRRTP